MPDTRPSCVMLADRHHGLTEGVRGLLETTFKTVVMVADEASLLEAADRIHPDVTIVDISLSQGSGLGWLRARYPLLCERFVSHPWSRQLELGLSRLQKVVS